MALADELDATLNRIPADNPDDKTLAEQKQDAAKGFIEKLQMILPQRLYNSPHLALLRAALQGQASRAAHDGKALRSCSAFFVATASP